MVYLLEVNAATGETLNVKHNQVTMVTIRILEDTGVVDISYICTCDLAKHCKCNN